MVGLVLLLSLFYFILVPYGMSCFIALLILLHPCAVWYVLFYCSPYSTSSLCRMVCLALLPSLFYVILVPYGMSCFIALLILLHPCAIWYVLFYCSPYSTSFLCRMVYLVLLLSLFYFILVPYGMSCFIALLILLHPCAIWYVLFYCSPYSTSSLCRMICLVLLLSLFYFILVPYGMSCFIALLILLHPCAVWYVLFYCSPYSTSSLCRMVCLALLPSLFYVILVPYGMSCFNTLLILLHPCAIWYILFYCSPYSTSSLCRMVCLVLLPSLFYFILVPYGMSCFIALLIQLRPCAVWYVLFYSPYSTSSLCRMVCLVLLLSIFYFILVPHGMSCFIAFISLFNFVLVPYGMSCFIALLILLHPCAVWYVLFYCSPYSTSSLCRMVCLVLLLSLFSFVLVPYGMSCFIALLILLHPCAVWYVLFYCSPYSTSSLCRMVCLVLLLSLFYFILVLYGVSCFIALLILLHPCAVWSVLFYCSPYSTWNILVSRSLVC